MSAKYIEPMPHIDKICLSGRWVRHTSGSISTSWAGSSFSFRFSGASLRIICGENTERKDRWNGSVSMIAVSITSAVEPIAQEQRVWGTHDVDAGTNICLLQNQERGTPPVLVHVTMIDWASTFELQQLIVDQDASIARPSDVDAGRHQILFIGDSITCGYMVEPEGAPTPGPPSRGCLDAFPFVAQELLAQDDPAQRVHVGLVSYPGWALVSPSNEEKANGHPSGMSDGYFQVSPWSTEISEYSQTSPTAVVIELGTNDQEYYSVKRYETCLHGFIDKLLESLSTPRYLWIVPPFSDFADDSQTTDLQRAFPNLIHELRTKYRSKMDVQLCDINSGLTKADTFDGLHPSIEGHAQLGMRMAEFIRARLAD